jgi:hypothetical protein
LKEPVEFGNAVVTTLNFRSPKAKDFRHIKPVGVADMTIGDLLDFAGKLAGKAPEFMDMLGYEDMQEALTVATDFLSGGVGGQASTQP